MAASDDKITACVAHYRKLLDGLPQPPESLSQAPDSRLHKIIERSGGKRRSPCLLAKLTHAFAGAAITTFPSLNDPDLELDDRVYMMIGCTC